MYREEALMMQQSLALPAVARFHLAGTALASAGGEKGRGEEREGVVCLKHGQHMWSQLLSNGVPTLCEGLVVDEFVKTSSGLATVLKENGLNQLALDCAQEVLCVCVCTHARAHVFGACVCVLSAHACVFLHVGACTYGQT